MSVEWQPSEIKKRMATSASIAAEFAEMLHEVRRTISDIETMLNLGHVERALERLAVCKRDISATLSKTRLDSNGKRITTDT